VMDKLAELKKDSWVVFELSSWRLSALGRYGISPRIAVLTNIYPDHLNYYSGMESYIRDKKFIFANQKPEDGCIINWDDAVLNKFEPEIKSKIIKFSKKPIERGMAAYSDDKAVYWNNGIDEKKVIEINSIKLRGSHNLENIMAAIGTAGFLGIDLKIISKTLAEFKGIPHRLEFVREINGVKYYNDTAATMPESAMAGLNSFTEPVILIVGGSDKKLDISELAEIIHKKAKGLIFLKGVATDKIIEKMKKITGKENSDFKVVESMAKAVEIARSEAASGDVVLLSPGAASFGMFQNEFDRGNQFKEAVNNLK